MGARMRLGCYLFTVKNNKGEIQFACITGNSQIAHGRQNGRSSNNRNPYSECPR